MVPVAAETGEPCDQQAPGEIGGAILLQVGLERPEQQDIPLVRENLAKRKCHVPLPERRALNPAAQFRPFSLV
jgi:hypothetical protein